MITITWHVFKYKVRNSLSLSLSHTHTQMHTHIHTHTHTHTHTHAYTHTHTHTHTYTHTHTHTRIHTHAYTHTHIHTHTIWLHSSTTILEWSRQQWKLAIKSDLFQLGHWPALPANHQGQRQVLCDQMSSSTGQLLSDQTSHKPWSRWLELVLQEVF